MDTSPDDPPSPRGDTVPPLPPAAEEFLTYLLVERGRASSTIAAYRRDLSAWWRWLAGRHGAEALAGGGPGVATTSDVVAFVAALRDEGLAPATVARRLVAVRSWHAFCADEGITGSDPTTEVEQPRVPAGLPKALDETTVVALIEQASGDDPLARRDRALLEVLYGTGARISEAVGLSLGDVDLTTGTLRVLGKGSRERIVPLGGAAAAAMERWLSPEGREQLVSVAWSRRDDAEAVFVNRRGGRLTRQGAWGVVRAHAEAAGISAALSPHVLRHSCATHMLDHGADIRSVQELLGHASVGTTQVYTKVSAAHLRAAYLNSHPRARRQA